MRTAAHQIANSREVINGHFEAPGRKGIRKQIGDLFSITGKITQGFDRVRVILRLDTFKHRFRSVHSRQNLPAPVVVIG